MTALEKRKSRLEFLTGDVIRERGKLRQVVIEAQPTFALVRLAGTRQRYPITWGAIYHAAAKLQADALRAERKARKGGSR